MRYFSRDQLKPPDSQPPLRPEAPKPANSRSIDDDAQRGICLLQIVGGPQAGIAGADNGDICFDIARQGLAGSRDLPQIRIPERYVAVAFGLHGNDFQMDRPEGSGEGGVGGAVVGQQLRVGAVETELDLVAEAKTFAGQR